VLSVRGRGSHGLRPGGARVSRWLPSPARRKIIFTSR
jgi:hypothetical protein